MAHIVAGVYCTADRTCERPLYSFYEPIYSILTRDNIRILFAMNLNSLSKIFQYYFTYFRFILWSSGSSVWILSFAHVAIKAKKMKWFLMAKRIIVTGFCLLKLQTAIYSHVANVQRHHYHRYSAEPNERKITENWTFVNTRHSSEKPKTVSDTQKSHRKVSTSVAKLCVDLPDIRLWTEDFPAITAECGYVLVPFDLFIVCGKWPKCERLHQVEYRIRFSSIHWMRCCVVSPIPLWPYTLASPTTEINVVNWSV